MFHSIILPQQQALKSQNHGKEIERCSLWTEPKKPWLVFTLGSLNSHVGASLISKEMCGRCSGDVAWAEKWCGHEACMHGFGEEIVNHATRTEGELLKISSTEGRLGIVWPFPCMCLSPMPPQSQGCACTPAALTLPDTMTVFLFSACILEAGKYFGSRH